jgi:hypothetical protein
MIKVLSETSGVVDTCPLCKEKFDSSKHAPTKEHPFPESLVGKNEEYTYLLCRSCNNSFSSYDNAATKFFGIESALYGVLTNKKGVSKGLSNDNFVDNRLDEREEM